MEINEKNRYYSFDAYCRERFGEKIYRISLDGGFTCPNRDGTAGKGGCIFCSGGSGFFSEKIADGIDGQIERAKQRVKNKSRSGRYIAYFQSFTGTYAPLERLKELYERVIERDDIAGLSIGTRPDCIGADILDLLSAINRKKPVFIELGLQSTDSQTAKVINRCYDTSVYYSAARSLRARGINVVTHIIFGFPWESRERMIQTVKDISSCTDGIKIHMLQILKGTEMEKMHIKNGYSLLSLEEYTDILCEAVSVLPENVVIHRMTGDPPKALLVQPLWTSDKKKVLNYIKKRFEEKHVLQGEKAAL